ncbi:MAG: DEAD/DEAH box helicase [Myxococcota bacterium]|nr:DEAD/DEAH box helicase [Myxococcota bacterium]
MSETTAMSTFAEMGLAQGLLSALAELNYSTPTPIQALAIPPLLAGRDIIGQAQTGTGKTAAFSLPLLGKIDLDVRHPQLLVLAPTRELALQVCEAMAAYGGHLKGLRVLPVYGGQGMAEQLRALRRGVHVVVGTPGRLLDHLARGTLNLAHLKAIVLDEADEMLRMGFVEDVERIMEQTPTPRQTALFSATMPAAIARIAQRFLVDPVDIRTKRAEITVDAISQHYVLVSGHMKKFELLSRLLEFETYDGLIVFARTRLATVEIAEKLEARGHGAFALNGDMSQQLRQRTIERFKSGLFSILVCTDVAARGLDVPRVSHVVNYDIPFDTEVYVHRIGRTGRAGRAGKAILFVSRRQHKMLRAIEKATRKRIERMSAPTPAQIGERRIQHFKAHLAQTIDTEHLDGFVQIIEAFCEETGCTPVTAAAGLTYLKQKARPFYLRPQRNDSPSDSSPEQRSGPQPQDDKPSAASHAPRRGSATMSVYRVEVGQNHGLEPKHLVGAISNEIDLPSRLIGSIRIAKDHSVVELPAGMPKEVLTHLKGVWVCGAQLKMTHLGDDKPRRRGRTTGRPTGQRRSLKKRRKRSAADGQTGRPQPKAKSSGSGRKRKKPSRPKHDG